MFCVGQFTHVRASYSYNQFYNELEAKKGAQAVLTYDVPWLIPSHFVGFAPRVIHGRPLASKAYRDSCSSRNDAPQRAMPACGMGMNNKCKGKQV